MLLRPELSVISYGTLLCVKQSTSQKVCLWYIFETPIDLCMEINRKIAKDDQLS